MERLSCMLALLLALVMVEGAAAAGPLTLTAIATGQIGLWFTVVMVLVLVSVISSLGGMDYQTDTLLFQKSKDGY
eukprot:CAMPEP_0184288476 /NCGR_PEP_ID=MMETSP1049-20130417/997_1 /TAXON_ID=77928 /ORGANISM="Proteomonas sulcata, Strain CCMP704" /LENGTH=74 /DNA_ID=CAMNT_0026594883 /DNA_START=12 /DNA_END=236 /DNA_ORIENTATION=+